MASLAFSVGQLTLPVTTLDHFQATAVLHIVSGGIGVVLTVSVVTHNAAVKSVLDLINGLGESRVLHFVLSEDFVHAVTDEGFSLVWCTHAVGYQG
ncbi:hypothetical protein Pcinc_040756 [Petrolisthes cinctipes]|uniref:Uncharacterized protein n=1 Tax=Petrolisthes cinctipes TaxID=88211 RepID=A0AAE1BLD9_PETCI|nr:hypothetical protein Pcinc_040756 [Petrolisthes cinctipes]